MNRVVRLVVSCSSRAEHVARVAALFEARHPLRVGDRVVVADAELGGQRRRRPHHDPRLDAHPTRAPAVVAEVRVPDQADHLAIVGVEVLPAVDVPVVTAAGPAAGQPVVEAVGVQVDAESGAPLVLERPVGVEVEAQVHPIAVEVVRRPLVEVDPCGADVAVGHVPPDLQPAVLRDLVGPLHEAHVVGVEAGRFVTDADVAARAQAAELVEVDAAGMAAQRVGQAVQLHVVGVGPLEAVHGAFLQRVDCDRASRHAAAGPVAVHAPAAAQPPVEVHAAGCGARGDERQLAGHLAVGRGQHEPQRRLVRELALRPRHRVEGLRFNRRRGGAARSRMPRRSWTQTRCRPLLPAWPRP